jgi:erythromycin esterase-like protein
MKYQWLILFLFVFQTFSAQDFKKKANLLNTSEDLNALILAACEKKLVLLGEASHGTHEYYYWRDQISRKLIGNHNFSFIAVEGDFASLYELNNYVKNRTGAASSAREVLLKLDRWPTWMWGNEEVVALAEWLRAHNDKLPQDQKVGFYGMDVYDEWRSKEVVLEMLKTSNNQLYESVKKQYECIRPYKGDSWGYANAVRFGRGSCDSATKNAMELIKNNRSNLSSLNDDAYFYLLQNATVFHNAEKFYRKSVTQEDAASWNSRVMHMHNTVTDLLNFYGENAKGIVWAHNTHIGDASFTSMRNFDQKNIGQLSRELHGSDHVFLTGFTTYQGKVMAGASWGAPMQEMTIPRATANSVESKFHKTGLESFYLIFDEEDRSDNQMNQVFGNRAVGVVYNPRNDSQQFVPTILPLRYDAIIYFRETKALQPLNK